MRRHDSTRLEVLQGASSRCALAILTSQRVMRRKPIVNASRGRQIEQIRAAMAGLSAGMHSNAPILQTRALPQPTSKLTTEAEPCYNHGPW
jgi:hypothetical protein